MSVEFVRQFLSIQYKASQLKARIESLHGQEYASVKPQKLCELLLDIVHILVEELDYLHQQWLIGEKGKSGIERQVRRIADSIAVLHSFLRFIEAARPEKTLYQMVIPLELLVADIAPHSKDDLMLIRPQWKYNFKYLDLAVELRKLPILNPEAYKRLEKSFIPIISFPGLEKENIFALTILAHEIGHYLDLSRGTDSSISLSKATLSAITIPEAKVKEWIESAEKARYLPESIPPILRKDILGNEINSRLIKKIPIWLRELTADIIGVRLLGPAYFFAVSELFGCFEPSSESAYPSNARRLKEINQELQDNQAGLKYQDFFEKYKTKFPELCKVALKELSLLNSLDQSEKTEDIDSLRRLEDDIVEQAIKKALDLIHIEIRKRVPKERCFQTSEQLFELALQLENRIPQNEIGCLENAKKANIDTILNAGWLMWLKTCRNILNSTSKINEQPNSKESQDQFETYEREHSLNSRLIVRAIELSHLQTQFGQDISVNIKEAEQNIKKSDDNNGTGSSQQSRKDGGVLTKEEIIRRMEDFEDPSKQLIITPLLLKDQIGQASIDVRLGNVFIVMKRTKFHVLDPAELNQSNLNEYQEEIYLRYGKPFVLHPGEFVLGSTLEYIVLPFDVTAYVIGLSSWGRLGLVIATATHVAPGFKGTITLELANLGTVPVILRPCNLIAQLVLHLTETPVKQHYSGMYPFSTGPEPSKIFRKKEFKLIAHDE
ncbi:MAG: dCTP deaminase [bacterium]